MWRKSALPAAALVAFVAAQGLYACWLNHLYYETYGPFYDSMSYTNRMADLLSSAKQQGVLSGIQRAFHFGTVSLPWILTALVSPVAGYSRLLGVGFQEMWMLLLAASAFLYMRRFRGASPWLAALWTVPFLSFMAVYRFNGGVSDFRMDLTLYLLLALASVWYLATYHTESHTPWVLSALFLALSFMNRATAPAYAAVMFVPILAGRWWANPGSRRFLARRSLLYLGGGAVLGAIPLAANWSFLHYYYFVWGKDPTAHLPLAQSARHFIFAAVDIGRWLALAGGLMFAARLVAWTGSSQNEPRGMARFLHAIDWKIAYLGLAPALLLTVTGAGMNPFVSMPSVFGFLLFCVAPMRGALSAHRAERIATVGLVLACALNIWNGYADHALPGANKVPMMAALRTGIASMEQDARSRGRNQAEFATAHIVDYDVTALTNVMIYELGAVFEDKTLRMPDGLTFRPTYQFTAARPLDRKTKGTAVTEQEKYDYLRNVADQELDYIFLPDGPSIDWMEKNRPFNFANLKVRGFKRTLLATGRWCAIGDPLVASSYETLQLYVNRRDAPGCGPNAAEREFIR